jgi:hypothetical protein
MMENPTNGNHSHSVNRTADTNKPVQMHDGMMVEGWVTIGYYDNDIAPTIYGLFETMEQAEDWLRKLKSGYVHIVYVPQYNRG